MLKTLKFSGSEHNFLFVSDLHFSHSRKFIIEPRNYSSVEEHDLGIIRGWNSYCSHESIVFNLGDIIFNDSTGEKFWQLMDRLNFRTQYLLYGNHISGHRQAYLKVLKEQFPDAIEEINNNINLKYEIYPLIHKINSEKTLVFLPQYAEIQINSTPIVLCHYPIISFNKQNRMGIHLNGHSHGGCELTNKDTGQGMRLDVGIESFGRPVSLKEIKYHLRDRTLDARDHHNAESNL